MADCPKPYFLPSTKSTINTTHSFIGILHSLVEVHSIAMAFKTLLFIAALAAAALAQSSSGCNKAATLTSGVKTINGRQYTLKVPANYDSKKPYRLVFGFHWLGGSMGDVVNGNSVPAWYGLDALSQGSAIFVAPNGLNNGWANQNGADVTFVDAIIKQVEAGLCVDQASRFATGFSYGGGMSYAIACARAGEFRAVAPIAAGQISGCSGGKDPIAYLGIHGVSDNVLPISGGITLANTFVRNNGCQSKTVGQPARGSGQIVRTDFQGCREPVSFLAWDGGHSGAAPTAPKVTWDFFTSLPRKAVAADLANSSTSEEAAVSEDVEAAPSNDESGTWQSWTA